MPLFRRKSRQAEDDQPVDPEARSPQLGVKYKDLAVMGQLVDGGADLSQPRHVVYYCYAPTEEKGRVMAEAARAQGFAAEVREPLPQFPGQWAVVSEVTVVVNPDLVRQYTDYFEALTELHGAEYDGWEASL